jgi:ribonuclease HI/probable phosphoglycerate mutase
MSVIDIYFDGSARPSSNIGSDAYSGVCFVEDGVIVYRNHRSLGKGTSNYAEFGALYVGLSEAYARGYTKANCFGDSQFVIDVMNDVISIKNIKFLQLYMQIMNITDHFDWVNFTKIPRNEGYHIIADQLAKNSL